MDHSGSLALDEVLLAHERLRGILPPTPVVYSSSLEQVKVKARRMGTLRLIIAGQGDKPDLLNGAVNGRWRVPFSRCRRRQRPSPIRPCSGAPPLPFPRRL